MQTSFILNYLVLYAIYTALLKKWSLLWAIQLILGATCYANMGVAAICYDHFLGFCYVLYTNKWPLLYAITYPLGALIFVGLFSVNLHVASKLVK